LKQQLIYGRASYSVNYQKLGNEVAAEVAFLIGILVIGRGE
jgi:hypothetical protein